MRSYNCHFRWRVCEEVRVLHLGQWGVGCTAGSGDIQSAGVPRDGQRGKSHDRSSSSMQQSQNSSSNTQSNSSSNIQTNTQSSNSSSNTCSQIHYWTHNKVKGNVKDTAQIHNHFPSIWEIQCKDDHKQSNLIWPFCLIVIFDVIFSY